jgi:LuxR family maltose regulon positive regulatory protein
VVPSFWEKITHNWAKYNPQLARAMVKLGFPDTKEKLDRYLAMVRDHVEVKSRIVVFDDFHCIEEPQVIRYLEESVFFYMPPGTTVFLLTRTPPRHINIANLTSRAQMFNISESDLRFTENELAQYFRRLEISVQTDSLREIMQDTEGWAFAINLIAKKKKKAPGYGGYVRNAMKINVFRLMETEVWDGISGRLQNFLVRLSLIDHLSVDLIAQLAEKETVLLDDLEKQSAYVRRDSYINAYIIHPLFLEFLRQKQESIPEEQKREIYTITAAWCKTNGFRIDALSYYEKTGDYQSIINILFEFPSEVPEDIARFAATIFDNAPADAFARVKFLAEMHIRTYLRQAYWKKTIELLENYEAKYLTLEEDDVVKKRNLARLYISWGFTRGLMCLIDDVYDFDTYTEKAYNCITTTIDPGKYPPHSPGPWICHVGVSRKGALEEYIAATTRHRLHLSHNIYTSNFMAGRPELAKGELEFYRGDPGSAVPHVALALKLARDNRQFGLIHRALFYALRIVVAQGNFIRAEQVIKETKDNLNEVEYLNRFIDYDISLSWYYCFLGLPEKAADWLKEDFSPYCYSGFLDNFGNQIKARFCYAARRFPPLLLYMEEMKRRESFLFGRIEMLAMEACVHYQAKDRKKAFAALSEAYKTASPNGILMPFIELGKDMRTLTSAAHKEKNLGIPKAWLEDINRRSASYAKRRSHIITEYRHANPRESAFIFTPREAEIFNGLSHGLSRAEIAAHNKLSINTVKMVINNMYQKTGAENLADLIRIVTERKMK